MSELEQRVVDLLDRISRRDFAIGDLLAEDAVFEVPYSGLEVRGRDAICDLFAGRVAKRFDPFRYEVTATYPGRDGDVLTVEYRSTGAFAGTDRPYANVYVGIFRGVGDRIGLWREYFDPRAV